MARRPVPGGDLALLGRLARRGAVLGGGLAHGVEAPRPVLLELPRACREDHARPVASSDKDVLPTRRAVDEIPLLQLALLLFDDDERRAGEDEEVFRLRLPV